MSIPVTFPQPVRLIVENLDALNQTSVNKGTPTRKLDMAPFMSNY
jgi:hypothetical protein